MQGAETGKYIITNTYSTTRTRAKSRDSILNSYSKLNFGLLRITNNKKEAEQKNKLLS